MVGIETVGEVPLAKYVVAEPAVVNDKLVYPEFALLLFLFLLFAEFVDYELNIHRGVGCFSVQMDIRGCKGKCVYLQVAFKNIHERDTDHGIVGLKYGAVALVADVYILK